jgi:transposase
MWTNENRARYDRSRLRYPSDLTDAEWGYVVPLIPPAKRGGNQGCQRRHGHSQHRLPRARHPEGSAAALDPPRLLRPLELGRHARAHPRGARRQVPGSHGARSKPDRRDHPRVEEPGDQPERQERGKRGARIDPPGYDAGKKIKGKKRHILVDTQGLLMHAIVHAADVQDRDGGALLMATLFGAFPFLTRLYADGGYQGPQFNGAIRRTLAAVTVEIVKRSGAKTFVVLPKRWIVERTLAWLGRCRRLAKDWECLNRKALAFLRLASIRLMLRKLCNPK